jgi:uncharacterized membrane protein YphA (DoxX/SURF4 family)
MNINSLRAGQLFYALAMAGVGVHQLFYADFCNFIFPAWPHPIRGYAVLACLSSAGLIVAGIAIMIEKQARKLSLILGVVLLLMTLLGQVPFEYLVIPYKKTHLALWVNPLKELALAGGAFCVAGSSPGTGPVVLEKFIPAGRFFFCTTMICFGCCHFLYTHTISVSVPSWIPGHDFWAYFTGAALIAGGVAIVINAWLKPAALLMGAMIFFWFLFVHIPDAVKRPLIDGGNEITAALSALAFSGIAFVIAGYKQEKIKHEKNLRYSAL